jgi:hypothetical protein
VGGTDKMSANTAVGTVRTYARIEAQREFDYQAWMDAVRRAETFVTYGPLLEFAVDGRPMGARIEMNAGGGTVDATWEAASVTVPMSRVELVVNGEVRESVAVDPWRASGQWRVRVARSSWLIEGAMAYLDTVGTRAEDRIYKRMRLVLESAHRSLHNRMHQLGHYHEHTAAEDHREHH